MFLGHVSFSRIPAQRPYWKQRAPCPPRGRDGIRSKFVSFFRRWIAARHLTSLHQQSVAHLTASLEDDCTEPKSLLHDRSLQISGAGPPLLPEHGRQASHLLCRTSAATAAVCCVVSKSCVMAAACCWCMSWKGCTAPCMAAVTLLFIASSCLAACSRRRASMRSSTSRTVCLFISSSC